MLKFVTFCSAQIFFVSEQLDLMQYAKAKYVFSVCIYSFQLLFTEIEQCHPAPTTVHPGSFVFNPSYYFLLHPADDLEANFRRFFP